MAKITNAKELKSYREELNKKIKSDDKKVIAICAGTGCKAYGSDQVVETFQSEIKKQGLSDKVEIKPTGCHGFCERGTLVLMQPEKQLYQRVKPEAVAEIVEKTLIKGEILEEHLYDNPVTGERHKTENDIPFYKYQERLILGKNGEIDPTKSTITLQWVDTWD